ncbi:prenyltransferase/squalene oxidase repeat-containing protein [Micromonospora sp. DT233]|uniref:prenyltransferase/squalene oxidase repeat-containing protein n=1 Tax=Micromonospora sp. DT233 TaxID=3393432 RepID=UPI003CE844D3
MADLAGIPTSDGGSRQGPADLWCTYAAVRTLTWLGLRPQDPQSTIDVLLRCQNADGGFAWQRGLTSDVWATYYCTQAMHDLGATPPLTAQLTDWLRQTQERSGGFAMTPGQSPDVWATYYAARTWREVIREPVPAVDAVRDWLAALQGPDGGLGWYPGATEADVRACYYAAVAWRAVFGDEPAPWRRDALIDWLCARQGEDGGFAFAEGQAPCLWATFRAVRALDALGARPARADDCVRWIVERQAPDGAFTRWTDYASPDVWACFSAVGALTTLGAEVPDVPGVARFLHSCALPSGGFTYRDPALAGDSLATASLLLRASADEQLHGDVIATTAGWLSAAHLPYEGGVMYMPGRGAEMRCTLWAVSALRAAGQPQLDADRLVGWLRHLQNSDGGFGYWHGRASDMVSTVSAVDILDQLGRPVDEIDTVGLAKFLESCGSVDGYRPVPGAAPSCAATAQAARAWHALGATNQASRDVSTVETYASRLGGYASGQRGVPDLLSTYQAVLTRRRMDLPVDHASLRRFVDKIRLADGEYAWSPLSRTGGGPLAAALGNLLDRGVLPPLNL